MSHEVQELNEIQVRRASGESASVIPSRFDLTPESFGVQRDALAGRVRVGVPKGWNVDEVEPCRWRVTVGEVDPDTWVKLRLVEIVSGKQSRRWLRCLPVRLSLRSTFDINRHAFPLRNSARVLGDVQGSREIFRETFGELPETAAMLLYSGLYRDIVYIRGSGKHRGGLCSGMARWAGLRALHDDDSDLPVVESLRQITRLHGRQLLDRALLQSALWFLRGSPRAAYQAVRNDMLSTGRSNRAFDLKVPVPWRRDVLTALVREGHTVVPYKIEQRDPDSAIVTVYDPNRGREPQEMTFDLRRNRYAYRQMVSLQDDGYGLIAIRHVAYETSGTAILATVGSIFWNLFFRANSGNEKPPHSDR